jgi:succinoglycan biosynthesis transport protein ExoP
VTLSDYRRMLCRRWYLVAAGALLGCIVGGGIGLIVPPTYTAQATMYFSVAANGTSSAALSAYDANILAEQQVTSISLLTSTERVARSVIENLNLPLTTAQLESKISAVSNPATVILVVSARDSSPQLAAAIANSTSKALSGLADTINQQAVAEHFPSVVANVIQPAVAPPYPSSGAKRWNVIGGLIAGLILGIAAALVRGVLDRSVRTESELSDLTGAPALGVIPDDQTVRLQPLTVDENPDSDLAETYRRLRIGLESVMDKRAVVTVVSAVRSEGRTAVVCNLALAFAEAGLAVAVLEADLRNPRIADYLGLEDAGGLSEVLAGEAALPDVVQTWRERLDVVTAGLSSASPGRLLASPALADAIGKLRRDHDVVLVDTPALLGVADAVAVTTASDVVIVTARYGLVRKGAIRQAVALLKAASVEPGACILNGVRPERRLSWKWPSRPMAAAVTEPHADTGSPTPPPVLSDESSAPSLVPLQPSATGAPGTGESTNPLVEPLPSRDASADASRR